jgi:superfamily II DNA or RNA helicase
MNAPFVPRDYQIEAIEAIFDEFKRVRSTLLVWATGVGKTEVFLKVAERLLDENPGQKALIIAHREELITQAAQRWRRNRGEKPAIEMADRHTGTADEDLFGYAPLNSRLVIASVQTLNSGKRCRNCTADCQACQGAGKRRTPCGCDGACNACRGAGEIASRCPECRGEGWICIEADCPRCFEHFVLRMQKFAPEKIGLLVIDEAHHAVTKSYKRIIRHLRSRNPGVKILGTTATPDRSDKEALGQIFESVAHEYSLPQPILDGYLVPVVQQFVLVEELNLAHVRTTDGDLNAGDLEREMLGERVLHKVTTPTLEFTCGLEPGTIDTLIRQRRLHELPALCTRREPTLIHAVNVHQAERMTEILNRYLPESALCIIGTTPKNLRHDGLRRFAEGGYQFLLSCGVFLEGTDLPNVSVVAVARPTKSRALYAQMIGRGLRPLPGAVDGVPDAAERRRRIAESDKKQCTVIDFVGNSGRHKLVSSADVLGNGLPDKLVERVVRKAAVSGQPVDVLRALAKAKEEAERKQREQARKDAQARAGRQEEAKRKAAEQRKGIFAGASYCSRDVDPFDVFDVAAGREPDSHRGRKPTEPQLAALKRFKIDVPPDCTFWQAHQLLDAAVARIRARLASYPQLKLLQKHGCPDTDRLTFQEASQRIGELKNNGWKAPASWREEVPV